MSNEMQFSGERLRVFRKKYMMTQFELARLVGIDRTYLARIEMGDKVPSLRLQEEIGRFVDDFQAERCALDRPVDPLSVRDHVAPRARMREAPVVSWLAVTAATSFLDLPHQGNEVIGTLVNDPSAFAVILEGESMEPEFHAGDRVVVAPHLEPRKGDAVLVKLADGQTVFRWFGRTGENGNAILLTSENPNYTSIEVATTEITFCYPCLEFWRRRHR